MGNKIFSSDQAAKARALSRWWILAGVIAVLACAVELVIWSRLPPRSPKIRGSKQMTNDALPKTNLVTDGAGLYFNQSSFDRSLPMRMSARGGEVVSMNTAVTNPKILDISPQSELLVSSAGGETD